MGMDITESSSDHELWDRSRAGDGEAFGLIFDRHRDRVFGHSLRVTCSRAEAEDVTAIVFMEAWRLRDRVRVVQESSIGWLLATTNNVLRNHTRTHRRYAHFLRRLPPSELLSDVGERVIEEMSRDEDADLVRRAFQQLRPLDQDVLTLCTVEGLSIADAAQALGVAEGTVKSRHHRATVRLRASFEQAVTARSTGASQAPRLRLVTERTTS